VGNREGGREKEETKIHHEQDRAVRSRHDDKTTSVERERNRELNTDEKRKTGPHMPGSTRECGVRYYGRGVLYMGD
jgi:hypothetical protein